MNTDDYKNFEDFILDESFRQYVEGTDATSIVTWNTWITDHAEMNTEFQKATNILQTLLHTRKTEVSVDKYQSLKEMMSKIEDDNQNVSGRRFTIPAWAKVAAMLILSIGLAWIWNTTYTVFKSNDSVVFNEIIVPIGEKSQVILPDGTHVWINSGSRFKYPEHFGAESRDVFLTGEAFFDVTKQNKKMFVVNTRDARVEVLGTAFNVKAYPEDAKTQTTVTRGLVSVKNLRFPEPAVLIRPNQMAEIKQVASGQNNPKASDVEELKVKNIKNVEAITCWKDQLLVFNNETLEDIALKMERWFNVSIAIKDSSLKNERFNGKFVNNETVYQVLEAIKRTTPIKYTVKENEIQISLKK